MINSIKKKKLCFISFFAYPLFDCNCEAIFGGSELQLYQLAKRIAADNKYEIDFIVGDFGQCSDKIFDRIRVTKAFSMRKKEFRWIIGAYYQFKFLKTLKRVNADVYIQRAAGVETGIIAFFCKLFKRKFIYMTASDIDVNGEYRKKHKIFGIFYEYGIKNASAIITQREEHKRLIKDNFKKDSVVIKNSFSILSEPSSLNERDYILWIGSAQALKQPEMFLEIAEAIPEEKFVMIMPKNNIKIWEKILNKTKNIPNLKFIEKIPFDGINEYYEKAKLFINTSMFEGFPNTFVQSVMNGTPIISLNVNPDNFLNKYNCGFCTEGSKNKITEEIKRILNNKSLWTVISKNAYNYAREDHDMERNIKKVKNTIDSLCKN